MSTHRIRIIDRSCQTCGKSDRTSYRLKGDLVVLEHHAELASNMFVQEHLAKFPAHVISEPVVSVSSEEDAEA